VLARLVPVTEKHRGTPSGPFGISRGPALTSLQSLRCSPGGLSPRALKKRTSPSPPAALLVSLRGARAEARRIAPRKRGSLRRTCRATPSPHGLRRPEEGLSRPAQRVASCHATCISGHDHAGGRNAPRDPPPPNGRGPRRLLSVRGHARYEQPPSAAQTLAQTVKGRATGRPFYARMAERSRQRCSARASLRAAPAWGAVIAPGAAGAGAIGSARPGGSYIATWPLPRAWITLAAGRQQDYIASHGHDES
jgi:hypothetical protein